MTGPRPRAAAASPCLQYKLEVFCRQQSVYAADLRRPVENLGRQQRAGGPLYRPQPAELRPRRGDRMTGRDDALAAHPAVGAAGG